MQYNVQRIVDYMQTIYGEQLNTELNFFKLDIKYPFLVANQFRRWEAWYPEANRYILQNEHISKRYRWTQWLASKKQYWFVWIYNMVLTKIVYGFFYK